jgi:signal transduction histidine kinase
VSDALDQHPEYVPAFPGSVVDDDDAASADEGAPPQREGLPRGYRMRADRHYVDLLNASSSDDPVRMVAAADIDGDKTPEDVDLRALLESIRRLGIVQPLLVRRSGARYSVIAGRKRLTAAKILRMGTVPCLVRELDDVQAGLVAAADNLMVRVPEESAHQSGLVAGVRHAIARHLATVRACADLATNSNSWMTRSSCDLIRAHSWRAAQLMKALDLVTNTSSPQRLDQSVRTVVDDVIDGFSAEARLSRITLKAEIPDDIPSNVLTDHEWQTGLSGALLATLPLLEEAPEPSLVVRALVAGPGATVLEIAQSAAPVSAALARHFFDDDASSTRPGGWSAAVGALAVKALAQRHGGSATMEVAADGGSRMRILMTRRSSAPTAKP